MSNIPGNFTDGTVTGTDDGGHSASLVMGLGEFNIENLLPDGREGEVYQAQGAVVGVRKGARALPTLSLTAVLAQSGSAFAKLAHGQTSGFVSVTADIGDYECIDLVLDRSYGAESRVFYFDDCRLTSYSETGGSPNQVAMTFEILGPVTDSDGNTWVSSR